MILIDGAKFSCLECVRGHRSSLCRHHTRPLLQVRSKGRPNVVVSTGNKNHRIAVFAEEIASSPEPTGSNCKNVPVVILKASDKHIIDLSSGQIVGPYNEEEQKNHMGKPVIRAESFVNSSACCSQGVSKVRKQCSCNQKLVSKSKILSTYISKRLLNSDIGRLRKSQIGPNAAGACCAGKKEERRVKEAGKALCCAKQEKSLCCAKQEKSLCCSKKEEKPMSCSNMATNASDSNEFKVKEEPYSDTSDASSIGTVSEPQLAFPQFKPQLLEFQDPIQNFPYNHSLQPTMAQPAPKEVFEVIPVPSCSILGSCSCSSDCQCPNCVVHNNNAPQAPNLEYLNNDTQFGSNLILTSSKDGSFHYQDRLANSIPNPVDQDIQSGEVGTHYPLAQNNDAYQQQSQEQLLRDGNFPNGNFRDAASMEFIQLLLTPSMLQGEVSSTDQGDSCTCADDACFCQNCETHGIIEGYRLDDIFVSKVQLDLLNKM